MIISVVCRLANGGMRKVMNVQDIDELMEKLDDLVDGERIESPAGPCELRFIREAGTFATSIPESTLPSRAISDWERHIIETLLSDERKLIRQEDDEDESEPWR